MQSNQELALARLIPRRSWTDTNGLGLFLWTALYCLGIVVSLIALTLWCDVLIVNTQVSPQHVVESVQEGGEVVIEDRGLLRQVERFGHLTAWSWLDNVCEQFAALRTNRSALVVLTVLLVVLIIFLMFARGRARAHSMEAARQVATWLRTSIHRQTLRLGPSDLTGQRYQAAFRLFTSDVDDIRDSLTTYRRRVVRGWMFIPTLLLVMFSIDWRLALQCLLPTAFCWFVYRLERKRGAAQRQLAEAHAETESRFLADGLKQTRLVRGYHMETFEQSLFESHLGRLSSESRTGDRLESGALRLARFVVVASIGIVFLLISMRVLSVSNPLPLSSGIVLAVALAMLYREASAIEEAVAERQQLHTKADQIYRYLDEIPEVGQAVGAKFIQPVAKSIIFESVHYSHQGHEILRGVDLRIEAGAQVAVVSMDPLVPRAAAYLLPRFIEPSKGRVLFDGEDIAWGTLESLRAETLYVGGDDPVLSGTVLENLICGDTRYTMQDAIEAAKSVHANKFLSGLPLGYETVLGEHGETVATGEKFQIGLARAVLRDPAVLIIQEPDEILGEDLRAAIDDAYQRLSKGRTLIFLPSRLSTIRRADKVVLLHEGRVEAFGSHNDLRKASELYRHWDYINFNAYSRESRRLHSGG
ncbi:putative multidrug export ATP-binding/permease protein [Thalassoglobus neptunius]|uniref:Putative multidrug export ATP-binding/permease protein n=1 Tax=Thalassoglobus neptunius TaxID=1938619 RepID=A0A5C5X697_9PLAN|nr:ABC transporter ATP-binding protein [Thalassoglobus neptunius]TWT57532.1 putative multidrug export ATP-binding/permease protein [Thalassoglobus neptunius]